MNEREREREGRKELFLPELMTGESNRAESDIELSSDESPCLDDIDTVLSPDKTAMSNFIYSHDLWTTTPLSGATNPTNHSDEHHQLINLKPIINEPLSPVTTLGHEGEGGKTVATIHRRPMLIAFTDAEACSPTGPTHFKCTQCHETFDSLLLGQEHANSGMCTSDGAVHVRLPFAHGREHSPHSLSPLDAGEFRFSSVTGLIGSVRFVSRGVGKNTALLSSRDLSSRLRTKAFLLASIRKQHVLSVGSQVRIPEDRHLSLSLF